MNKIRELRKDKKLTLDDLSKELQEKVNFKISSNALGKYERGIREPKLETWKKLANFFGVSVAFIQGENTFQDIKDFSHKLMIECIFNKQLYSSKDKSAFYKLHSCLEKFAEMNKIDYQETFTNNERIRKDAISIAEAMFKEVFSDAFFERIRMSKIPTSPSYELANALVQQFMNYFNNDNNLIDNDLIYIEGIAEHLKAINAFIEQTENFQKLIKFIKDDNKNLGKKLSLVKSSLDNYSSDIEKIRDSMAHGNYKDKG